MKVNPPGEVYLEELSNHFDIVLLEIVPHVLPLKQFGIGLKLARVSPVKECP